MVREALIETFQNSWPIFAVVLIIISLIHVADLVLNKKKPVIYHDFLMLGFITYILGLFYIVTFDDVSWSTSNFNLFHEILRYDIGSRLFFKNVINNIFMFVPYGFFVGYYLRAKKVTPIIVITFITSLSIEVIQLMIGRVFDVDDILLNTIGGILGYLVYKFMRIFQNSLPKFLKKEWFYNILALIMLVFIVFYFLNIYNIGDFLW